MEESSWDFLGSDLIELILSQLPLRSIFRSSLVCKSWHSIITSSSFKTRVLARKLEKPWLFSMDRTISSSRIITFFAYDPESNEWIKLPVPESLLSKDLFTWQKSGCKSILSDSWSQTSPRNGARFIFVGGVRLVSKTEDCLALEIYNPYQDSYELCLSLPAKLRSSGNSSRTLCSASFKQKFYLFGMHSFFISYFDLEKHIWSPVRTLRPPGALFSYLISLQDRLILAGLCDSIGLSPSFMLWKIDENTLEFSEMEIMPQELLSSLLESRDEECDIFSGLKCVGFGNIIYVFNDEPLKNYPACVCEISSCSGKCRWRRLPMPQRE